MDTAGAWQRAGLEGRVTGGSNFNGRLANNLVGGRFSYSDTADSVANVFIGIDGRHELSDSLSLLLDVEYSHDIGGVSERSLGGFVRLKTAS